jgi:hypothetical protein
MDRKEFEEKLSKLRTGESVEIECSGILLKDWYLVNQKFYDYKIITGGVFEVVKLPVLRNYVFDACNDFMHANVWVRLLSDESDMKIKRYINQFNDMYGTSLCLHSREGGKFIGNPIPKEDRLSLRKKVFDKLDAAKGSDVVFDDVKSALITYIYQYNNDKGTKYKTSVSDGKTYALNSENDVNKSINATIREKIKSHVEFFEINQSEINSLQSVRMLVSGTGYSVKVNHQTQTVQFMRRDVLERTKLINEIESLRQQLESKITEFESKYGTVDPDDEIIE